jgi:hypothetical protein
LGAVGASLIFGLIRGSGTFNVSFPTFVLVSRMQLAQQYRGNGHFLRASSSSKHESMVDVALARDSLLRVGLGVSGTTIVSGSYARPSYSWISRLLTSSLSLGISSFFLSCYPVYVRYVDSSTLAFSLSSHRPSFITFFLHKQEWKHHSYLIMFHFRSIKLFHLTRWILVLVQKKESFCSTEP